MSRFILLFLGLILMESCVQEVPTANLDKEKITREVQQMLNDYFADIKAEGLQAEFKYLDDSPDFFWVPPGFQSAISYDSVKTILQANAGGLDATEFEWKMLKVNPLSENIVSYTGIVGGRIIDTAKQVTPVSMIETGTIVRRNKGWKILCGQSRNLTDNQ